MDIYMLYTPDEANVAKRRNFLSGTLSYIAQGSSLFSAKLPPSHTCDVMVISADEALPTVAPAIYDEARRRSCRRIFLDTAGFENENFHELCASLLRRGLAVFSPYTAPCPHGVIPVVDVAVTGGHLSELLEKASRTFPEFAVSVSPMFCTTPLPAKSASFRPLSRREVYSILNREESFAHFSPQMLCKYFLQNPDGDNVSLILFDDKETLSSKIRLAKKHGASHAFFVHSEISEDIF